MGSIIRGVMTNETADQLIRFLAAMSHYSREHALKLKALELIAKKHPEIFQDYEQYLEDLRMSRETRETLDRSESALAELRKALVQE